MGKMHKTLKVFIVILSTCLLCIASYGEVEKGGKSRSIPILLYHHFQEQYGKDQAGITITPAMFEEHVKALKINGYKTVSLYELYKGELPDKAVMITMDDGYLSNYLYAYPILKKYGMHAVIFVVTSKVGFKGDSGASPRFTWKQAEEMEKSGVIEIGSHALEHRDHMKLSVVKQVISLYQSRRDMDEHLGSRKIRCFAYPYAKYDDRLIEIAGEIGFDMQMTGLDAASGEDVCNLKRISVPGTMNAGTLLKVVKQSKSSKGSKDKQ